MKELLLALWLCGAVVEPCPEEDAHNCVWIAEERGNGRGESFVDVGGVLIPLT